ncbi:MAG: hypothetical protein ABI175_17600, partial [Polyangiales bacterium]
LETTDPALAGISADLKKFDSRFAAPLAPNGGITDGEFIGISEAFLDAVAAAKGSAPFETEVIVHVVVYGDLAGSEVTSQAWQFPVTVCNTCVVNVLGTCPLPAGTTVADGRGTCSMFQDGFVDCCSVGTMGALQCPAAVGAQYPLTVTVTGSMTGLATTPGTGSVMSAPAGIMCLGDCEETYNQGTTVTLTATPTAPATGTTTVMWSGNCTGTATCMVTMDGAKNVTATFVHNQ